MALFVELIPLLSFFIAYQWTDLYIATSIMMCVSMLQITISWLQKEPIPIERWVNVTALLLLGSITLIFKNSHFIKWKPTIGYGILATQFILTSYRHNSTLLERAFGNQLTLSKKSWTQLNNIWAIFFCIMGLLNLIVAYNTETNTWVYFKFFGALGLTSLFILGQMIYLFYFKKNQLQHELTH